MERKSATMVLNDGKEYTFSERNREDVNLTTLQNKYRASRIKQIKEVHSAKDELELRDALIFQEWGRMYVDSEVWKFVIDDPEAKMKLVYASFKIANPAINIEAFEKLVDDRLIDKLLIAINKLEQEDPALDDEVVRELKIDRKLFVTWKKDHPEVYWAIKNALKKKAGQA